MPGIPNERGSQGGNAQSKFAIGSFDWNPIDWWNSWFKGVNGWLGGLGGDIASGIESGYISILKDTWNVVLPFLEIIVGVMIATFAITVWLLSSDAGKSAATALLLAPK